MCVFSEVHAQIQSYDEAITEEDLQLIQERESSIRQLEVWRIQAQKQQKLIYKWQVLC